MTARALPGAKGSITPSEQSHNHPALSTAERPGLSGETSPFLCNYFNMAGRFNSADKGDNHD
jgi:hypothetical protein